MTTPKACTLPSADRPLRLAEFASLFANHLLEAAWLDDRTAVFLLVGDHDLPMLVRDLAARETECCSFFAFDVQEADHGQVALRVQVPRRQRPVLRAMVDASARAAR